MASSHAYLILLLCVQYAFGQDLPLVSTSQGLVRGRRAENGDYDVYLGIPYGLINSSKPFELATPYPAFEGIFDAVDDSAVCPQRGLSGEFSGTFDCLHLSVSVPSSNRTSGLMPVLVYVHGGGFEFGSFTSTRFGPRFLIRHDIIIVTLNYRVSVYGFMCTDNPRVPGNQGLKDLILGLRWIQDNIENFGGDPNKVTVSGASAGGMAVDLLVISEEGSKLFQQSILQSGVAFLPNYPTTVRNAPVILSEHLGLSTNDLDEALDFLTTVDPYEVISKVYELGLEFFPCIEKTFEGAVPFMPENWVTKEVISTAKNFNILLGFTDNEALDLQILPNSDLTNVVNTSVSDLFYIDHEDFYGLSEVRHFFFGDDPIDSSKLKNAVDLQSDISFVHNAMKSVYRYAKSDVGKMYLYLFSYHGERNTREDLLMTNITGAVHSDEMAYLYDQVGRDEPNEADQLIIDRMTAMWANFVKYGDPTPEVTELLPVKWEAITPTSPLHYMHIDSNLTAGTSPYNERMAFWDLFYELNKDLMILPSEPAVA